MAHSEDVPLYGDKPLPYSTEPVDLRQSDRSRVEGALGELLREVEDFTNQAVKDPKLLRELGVPENIDPAPTPLGLHIPFARFDFLWDGKTFQILELNTDGTAGFNVMEWIGRRAGLRPEEDPNYGLSERLLHALLEHSPKAPEVILVDFRDVGTSWEQKDLVQRWSKTHKCSLADPGTRTWNDGALIYRRALSWQLRARSQRAQPFLDDWRDGKITVVGGWSSDVGMSKAWMSKLKSKHCPETILLNDQNVKRLTSERDAWILKGALSYSGHSIVRGLDLTDQRWELTLQQLALEAKNGRPWVAQRRIELPKLEGRAVEFGLYFLNGRPSGYMCRWGHDAPITETSEEILRPVRIIS